MSNCIKFDEFAGIVELIDENDNIKDVENYYHKPFRYKTDDISPEIISDTLIHSAKPITPTGETINERMANMFYKLYGIRESLNYKDSHKAIPDVFTRPDMMIPHSIAITELMDAIKGEVNKAGNYGVPTDAITHEGSPTTPTARLSAVIGRAILAKNGIKFGTHANSPLSPVQVEKAYATIGMNTLESLKEKGFINIQKSPIINDFVDKATGYTVASASKREADNLIQAETASLNLDKDGMLVKMYGDDAIQALRDSLVNSKDSSISNEYTYDYSFITLPDGTQYTDKTYNTTKGKQFRDMLSLFAFTSGVKRMVVPTTVVPMALEPEAGNESNRDTQVPTKTLSEGRDILNNTPMYYKSSMYSFLEQFSKSFKNAEKSLPAFISSLLADAKGMNQLFGLESSDVAPSLSNESIRGKNISSMSMLEDILQFWDTDLDETTPQYTSSFQGSNIRLYGENSIGNVQTSKLARDFMTTTKRGTITIDLEKDTEAYKHLVSHLLDDSGLSESDILGNTSNPTLEKALQQLKVFTDSKSSLEDKLNAIMLVNQLFEPPYDSIKKPSFMHNMSILEGISDVREGSRVGKITTQYMTTPDATANGATLNTGDAIGTNPEVVTLLQRMGVLKKDGKKLTGKDQLNDIYAYVEDMLVELQNPNKPMSNAGAHIPLLEAIINNVYRGSIRNLAKAPTTTLLYKQGDSSAITSIARDISEAIGLSLHRGAHKLKNDEGSKAKAAIANLEKLLELEPGDLLGVTPEVMSKVTTKLSEKNGLAAKIQGAMKKKFGTNLFAKQDKLSKSVFNLLKDTWSEGKTGSKYITKAKELRREIANKKSQITFLKKTSNTEYTKLSHKNSRLTPSDKRKLQEAIDNRTSKIDGLYSDIKSLNNELNTLTTLAKHLKLFTADSFLNESMTAEHLAMSGLALEKTRNVFHPSTNVVTMENVPAETVWNVSPTHAQDAYSKTKSDIEAKKTLGKDYVGNMNVHDMTIGNPFDTQASKTPYVESMKDMFENYSKLQAGLVTTRLYLDTMFEKGENPGLEKRIEVLEAEVQGVLEARRKILSNPDTSFIVEDSTLFGENDSKVTVPKFNKPTSNTNRGIMLHTKDSVLDLTGNKLQDKIRSIAMDVNPSIKIENGDTNKYDLATNTITLVEAATSEQVTHELIHAATAQKIANDSKYATKLQKVYDKVLKENPDLLKDIESKPKEERLHEFMALAISNDTFINELKGTKSLGTKVIGFVRKLLAEVFGMTTKELDNAYGDTLALFNKSKYDPNIKGVDLELGFTPYTSKDFRLTEGITNKVTQANLAVYSMVVSRLEDKAISTTEALDSLLTKKFPMYTRAKDIVTGIYNKSPILQQLLHYVDLSDFKDPKTKNEVLSRISEIQADQVSRDSAVSSSMHKLTKDFSKEQKDTFFKTVTSIPLADFFKYSPNIKTADEITNRVVELTKELSKRDLSIAEAQVDMYLDGTVSKDTVYNLDSVYPESDRGNKVKELTALLSISRIGKDKVLDVLSNPELLDMVKDNTLALDSLYNEFGEGSIKEARVKGSLVGEYYKGNPQTVAITLDERKRYEYEEGSGWKILREPTRSTPGIAYRLIEDTSYTQGAGVDIGYLSNDVYVHSNKIGDGSNVVNVGSKANPSYKMILTPKDKEELGLITDGVSSLVKSTSHMIAAHESQVIRDKLMSSAFTSSIKSNNDTEIKDIQDKITDRVIDHPWFIKLGDEVRYDKLPDDIKAKYMPIGKRLSDIKGFNKEVSLVRKDISHWLTGTSNNMLSNYPKLQKISRYTKRLVSMKKIGQIIANPAKIAVDTESNIAYLATMGVPVSYITTEGVNITEEYNDLNSLRSETAKLRIRHIAYPNNDNIQKSYDTAKANMKNSHLYGAVERGFINSLSSDIINNNLDTTEGLQADINDALTWLLKNDKGAYNGLAKQIDKFTKLGFNGEDILNYIGEQLNRTKAGEVAGKRLQNAAKNIATIKSDGDVVSYVNQFLLAPNSELVKSGILANDLSDLIAKETYFRWLVSQGKSEDDATNTVLKAFPDYKENLPLKDLSDYGILMYPSYYLRIQKPNYRMIARRPINMLIGGFAEAETGIDIATPFDANIVNKINSYGGLFHHPYENLDITHF